MKLRTRLIVAFLLLSVVPLGVVTVYSYNSNVEAMQDVATREADLLAGELSERMQLVTAQLSEKIDHLMDVAQPTMQAAAVASAPAPATEPAPAPKPAPAKPAAPVDSAQFNQDVANALGEAAILLNSVQMQSGRSFGSGRGDGRGGDGRAGEGRGGASGSMGQRAGGQGAKAASGGMGTPQRQQPPGAHPSQPPQVGNRPAMPLSKPTPPPEPGMTPVPPTVGATPVRTVPAPAVPGQIVVTQAPPGAVTSTTSSTAGSTAGGATAATPGATPKTWIGPPGSVPSSAMANATRVSRPPGQGGPGTITFRLGGPGVTGVAGAQGVTGVQGDEGTQIDLTQIRRDLYRQILPNGTSETLTAEDRQRVAREVNQRMLGIVEGIKLSAIEIQKKADQARLASTSKTAAANKKPGASTAVAPEPPAPPAAPPAPVAPASMSSDNGTKRTAKISGNRLDVQVTRNGEVVRAANAEINLPNVLMTVFATMPREQGEVPFAVDKDGKVYAQSDDDKKKVEGLGAVAKPNGPLGKTVLPAWIVVTTAEPTGSGLRFGIARPLGDSLTSLRQTAGRNAGFGLVLIAIALAGVTPLSSRLTRNLSKLTEGVKRIAGGDYRARVDVKAGGEVGELAAAVNQMAEEVELHQRAAVEQERIRRELELGRQIQHDMQPHGALRLGLTEITGVSVSAREVGGDFFNYFELASGHIAMLVGDVSGKGVGAALLMANIQASLRTRLSLGQDLKAVAEEIDRDIEANSPGPLYATLFVGILNPVTRMLRYVNAGHHPQFVLRRQGGLERMSSTGMPVGLMAGHGHNQLDMQLAEGDRLFFYTDGCVEAENEKDDMFGAERLEAVLNAMAPTATPQEVLVHIERAIEQFRGSRELFDDVTVMALRVG